MTDSQPRFAARVFAADGTPLDLLKGVSPYTSDEPFDLAAYPFTRETGFLKVDGEWTYVRIARWSITQVEAE